MDNSAKIGFCPKFLAFATSFARGENDMVFIGKKALIFAVAAVLSLTIASLGIFAVAKTVGKMSFPVGAVVVIDAGHGGADGGGRRVPGPSPSVRGSYASGRRRRARRVWRVRVLLFLTAMCRARLSPTSTTSFLPRVTPV